ncbi:Metallo-dependent phosphatase-like protein, partial [Syncephalis pseudoplumigaleata]
IAVVGCGHGELDAIYAEIQRRETTIGCRVDLLIICGDFQAVRNFGDLACMACPVRYRRLGDFHRYYSGEKKAPVLTLFIGGNHEASNHLQELYYGGWVCPNIYYLGAAGVVRYGGLRIGGISGIFNPRDYKKGRFERPPYNRSDERSIYHLRGYDVERLALIREGIHVMASHDWPCNIEKYGNVERLIAQKRHLASDIYSGRLGAPAHMYLLQRLQPCYWFSAHLHAYFTATFTHPTASAASMGEHSSTTFVEIDDDAAASSPASLSYDPEWLAILRATRTYMSLEDWQPTLPHADAIYRCVCMHATVQWDIEVLMRAMHHVQGHRS